MRTTSAVCVCKIHTSSGSRIQRNATAGANRQQVVHLHFLFRTWKKEVQENVLVLKEELSSV